MLLINPGDEQDIRTRIAIARELSVRGADPKEVAAQNEGLDKLERSMDDYRRSEGFKRLSSEYWSKNSVQITATLNLLEEMESEIQRLALLADNAGKQKDGRRKANELDAHTKRLTEAMSGIVGLVPSGTETGDILVRILEGWERMKGASDISAVIRFSIQEAGEGSLASEKKLEAEKTRLAGLEKDFLSNKLRKEAGKPWDELKVQRAKVADGAKMLAQLQASIARKKKTLQELQDSIPLLAEGIRNDSLALAKASEKARGNAPGAGIPLGELMLEGSIPYMRSVVEACAGELPKGLFEKRQGEEAARYEGLARAYEQAVMRAKARAKCRQCRETVDALMSGASDHDSPEVKRCAGLIEEGEIFEARKALELAISSGGIHGHSADGLRERISELVKIYDEKGEVSKAGEKLKSAGSAMFRSRLDLMRIDFLGSGVHSAEELWKSADETLRWLTGLGMVFDEELGEEMSEMNGKPEFMAISNLSGLSKEQAENAGLLAQMLENEANALSSLKGSDAAKGIMESEGKIAAIVSANENFSNGLFQKSLAEGDQNAIAIRDRAIGSAGEYSEALEVFLKAAMEGQAVASVRGYVQEFSSRLARLKSLCEEMGKLKANAPKGAKAQDAYRRELRNKTRQMEELLKDITGTDAGEELAGKISDPKLDGKKLYSELASSPAVSAALQGVMEGQARALREIAGAGSG